MGRGEGWGEIKPQQPFWRRSAYSFSGGCKNGSMKTVEGPEIYIRQGSKGYFFNLRSTDLCVITKQTGPL